jgi:hypothetical protein
MVLKCDERVCINYPLPIVIIKEWVWIAMEIMGPPSKTAGRLEERR